MEDKKRSNKSQVNNSFILCFHDWVSGVSWATNLLVVLCVFVILICSTEWLKPELFQPLPEAVTNLTQLTENLDTLMDSMASLRFMWQLSRNTFLFLLVAFVSSLFPAGQCHACKWWSDPMQHQRLLSLKFSFTQTISLTYPPGRPQKSYRTPPPPTPLKPQMKVDFVWMWISDMGNARNLLYSRAPLRGARRGRAGISFSTWACASRRRAPSSFAFTMPEEEGAFDSVSAHLLATAANIFGWAGDPTK